MKARCRMEIEFPQESDMEAAAKAVAHEGGLSERSSARIEKDKSGKKIILTVEAQDVVALRATINAFMRAFQVFEGIEAREDKPESG